MICMRVVTAGIALLIVLPVLRVFLMLVVFVRERDFRFSAIAMLVLAIILLGSVLDVVSSSAHLCGAISAADFPRRPDDICGLRMD
jgi:hypothetical protein